MFNLGRALLAYVCTLCRIRRIELRKLNRIIIMSHNGLGRIHAQRNLYQALSKEPCYEYNW